MSGFVGGGGSASGVDDLRASVAYNFFLDAVDHGRDVISVAGGRVDEFETQDGVDDTLSTGETYDATDDFYSNPGGDTLIGAGVGTAEGDMTGGGGLAAAFDGNTNQATAAGAYQGSGGVDGTIGKDYSAAPKAIAKGIIYGVNDLFGFYDSAIALEIILEAKQAADPGWTQLGTSGAVVCAASQTREILSSDTVTAWDHVRFRVTYSAGHPNSFRCAEAEFYAPDPAPALELISEATTAAAVPTTGYATAWIELPDGGTVNTDFGVSLSRDDGDTWDDVDLSERATVGAGKIYFGDVGFTGAASDQMRWRVWANEGTEVKVHGVADSWGAA